MQDHSAYETDDADGNETDHLPDTLIMEHEKGGNEEEIHEQEPTQTNDLNTFTAATLLMADCMGTGILALPQDVQVVLGPTLGLTFLVLQLPVNAYAGWLLAQTAEVVEGGGRGRGRRTKRNIQIELKTTEPDDIFSVELEADAERMLQSSSPPREDKGNGNGNGNRNRNSSSVTEMTNDPGTKTRDLVRLAENLYRENHQHSHGVGMYPVVLMFYYSNIFLVLGNYILVMSHAVRAMLGVCIPTAGLLASTLMLALAQIRTMAKLGKWATFVSLIALAVVVTQCLLDNSNGVAGEQRRRLAEEATIQSADASVMRKLASLSSIVFAVGSQKLFLNIRHAMANRQNATRSLYLSLATFCSIYILVCLLAGPDPPGFLFDAISPGFGQRIGGFFLWLHVAVSYAINSQALASSLQHRTHWNWKTLTFLLAACSYFVANAIPFFVDLVALIGAITTVPLTLLLPALFYRRAMGLETKPWGISPPRESDASNAASCHNLGSWVLVVFSTIIMIFGTLGALYSIELDWSKHGPPFACE